MILILLFIIIWININFINITDNIISSKNNINTRNIIIFIIDKSYIITNNIDNNIGDIKINIIDININSIDNNISKNIIRNNISLNNIFTISRNNIILNNITQPNINSNIIATKNINNTTGPSGQWAPGP